MKDTDAVVIVNESTLLLGPNSETATAAVGDDIEGQPPSSPDKPDRHHEELRFAGILTVLLVGVFAANADSSLVLATYGSISSEFNQLENAGWLLTSYMLAMCGAQPLYGKLSNIWGRKALLLSAYVLFAAGNLICGVASTMSIVMIGRVISGAGGAGMSSVVSFIIADLVPPREVATHRSYVNIVQTVGRSCGGPVGGWLAQTMGWRWSFLMQCPLTILAMLLVWLRLNIARRTFSAEQTSETFRERLKRIDFIGITLVVAIIVAFLMPLSLGGNQVPWSHPVIPGLFLGSAVLGACFAYVESRIAEEPIFPLQLLTRRDVVLPYTVHLLQNLAQSIMMFAIPLYFQITAHASPVLAGFYLVPAVVGNTLGGVVSGAFIKRYGTYKMLTMVAAVITALCHTLRTVRWTGSTKFLESLYIFPGGFGTGIIHSSTFIAVQAATTDEEMAIAFAGSYLFGGFGSVLGITLGGSVMREVMFKSATTGLSSLPDGGKPIIERALSDYKFLESLDEQLQRTLVGAYVRGFRTDFAVSLLACALSFVCGIGISERILG